MLDYWLEAIKNMSIFLICAQVLIHLKPKGAYEKYLRLLISVMLLVQLLEPVGRLVGILHPGELAEQVQIMEKKLSQVREESWEMEKQTENIWKKLLEDVDLEDVVLEIVPEDAETETQQENADR